MSEIILTQDQDNQGNIVHTETEASIVNYKEGNVEENLDKLNDREEIFTTPVDDTKAGIYFDESDMIDSSEDNNVVSRIKDYVNEQVGDKKQLPTVNKTNIVESIKEVNTSLSEMGKYNNVIMNGNLSVQANTEVTLPFDGKENDNYINLNTAKDGAIIKKAGNYLIIFGIYGYGLTANKYTRVIGTQNALRNLGTQAIATGEEYTYIEYTLHGSFAVDDVEKFILKHNDIGAKIFTSLSVKFIYMGGV